MRENGALVDNDCDEELQAALRRELIEIARFNGVTDPEILRDILLARPIGSVEFSHRSYSSADCLARKLLREPAQASVTASKAPSFLRCPFE